MWVKGLEYATLNTNQGSLWDALDARGLDTMRECVPG
jgi:hypothetical protein